MQTSKSYATDVNNIHIKLELDDLEYVFADGRNLIINHDETADDADNEKFVYTDGTQAVVLQSGVKHYIQTVEGETYLVDNDTENIQQLVINTEDHSEDSNSAIEYVEGDENGEAVIYKLSKAENEVFESQPHPKRFKIGDAEYVTLNESDDLQVNGDNQFSILDEDSISENDNFQYAILKDGKLHLQLCETDSIEVLSDDSKEKIEKTKQEIDLTEDSSQYIIDKDKVQEYVIVNTELSPEDTVNALDLTKITSKKFLAGKPINLDDYLNQIQYKVNQVENIEIIGDDDDISANSKPNQYLNKKLLIRKNRNGKSLFGRILHIEHAKQDPIEDAACKEQYEETENSSEFEVHSHENNHVFTLDNYGKTDANEPQEEIENNENNLQHLVNDNYKCVIDADCTNTIGEEQMNFLLKTLNGLVDMSSFRKKLMDHRLEIKYIEKYLNEEDQEVIRDARFVSGILVKQNGECLLNSVEDNRSTTSLTVTVIEDSDNQKTTKVTFHEKPILCQSCNRNFKSLAMLTKHIQLYHMDKILNCNVCQLKFTSHTLLNEHRKANRHYFNCGICNKRFTTQGSLKRHRNVHDQNLKLECGICKAQFATVTSLSKHLLSCTYMKVYRCETCGKSFMTYGDLNSHKKVHNHSRMCHCDICGRRFSRHSNLLRHIEIHKGKGELYKCDICECSYKFISSLTRHIVQNHMKQSVE